MDLTNNLLLFDAASSGIYSGSLGLTGQSLRFDASKQDPMCRGLPVQAQDSFRIYNGRSDVHQQEDEASPFDLLDQYPVALSTSETNCILDNEDLTFFTSEELDVYLGLNETASHELEYTELDAYTVTHPPLQGSSC